MSDGYIPRLHMSTCVVLFQLGGPDSLEAVEPFLFNLFSDPDIIQFPFARLARPVMARLISSHRARHVQEHYAGIGGRSPIRELTERQAVALEAELRLSLDARVLVAMRYWHPLCKEAVAEIANDSVRQLVLLPLYPQYSKTTTGSSLNDWTRQWATLGATPPPTQVVREFYNHPEHIDWRRLGLLEIFEGTTLRNLMERPLASVLWTGNSPVFVSFQVDCVVELITPEHPRYRFSWAMRRLFEYEPFHVVQTMFPYAYTFWVCDWRDKTPKRRYK